MGAVLASVALGVLIGLTSHGGSALLAFVLGMLFFPAYVWATVTAFQRKRDWVGFGMIAAVLLAWPAFTIACFAAVGPSFN